MLISIVVLSYNRPAQIKRILENLVGVISDDIKLIIKDDRSPRVDEINKIVEEHKGSIGFEVELYLNSKNLGYDRNLLDSFYITDSDYVFLLSDDDYILGDNFDELISIISKKENDVYFTPYYNGNIVNRKKDKGYSEGDFKNIIYNSILFSGLIFNRNAVLRLEKNIDFLADCIYTQVYLASLLAYNSKSYGFAPENVLFLGGDGENFFGKNQSAVNSDILSDRDKITSNMNYQPFLLKVVDEIAHKTHPKIKKLFLSEYSKRLISYGLKARSAGISVYYEFYTHFLHSKLPFRFLMFPFFCSLFFVPKIIAKKIHQTGLSLFRKAG